MKLAEKINKLKEYFSAAGDMAIAFSGGTDSAFLLAAALKYSSGKVIAVTVITPYMQKAIASDAGEAAGQLYTGRENQHVFVNVPTLPDAVLNNPLNRCYECKKVLLKKIICTAAGINIHTIIDGSNADDLNDYRPGFRALKELNVKSPLLECGFTKDEIRIASRKMKLPGWNKNPAACLLTRLPYNRRIGIPALEMVESAEIYILEKGFTNVRIRTDGKSGIIEISKDEIPELASTDIFQDICIELKKIGYENVSIDFEGYRCGSMNNFLMKKGNINEKS